jgi:molybdate transport system substrate-binding protein
MRTKATRFQYLLFALIPLLLLLGGCAPQGAADEPPASSELSAPGEVIVFAAASLTDAMTEVAHSFEAANPGTMVTLNFGSSSQLAAQLVEGAPADVFASANPTQMQVVVDDGRVEGEPALFATNRLTAIVPADNPAGIESLDDLAQPGIALVLAVPGVPVRDYTDESIAKLADDPAYGLAFADAFYANLVSEEDNVRQVAAKVALGEADAGVVYTSDVTPDIADQVIQIAIPDAYNVIASYPIAPIADAPNPAGAVAFVDHVMSGEGQAILGRWRFGAKP